MPWVQEDVLFRDLAGLPKPVPGETALVFFRSGNWLVTPFTHGESGYWRVVQVDGEQHLANDQGRCLDRAAFASENAAHCVPFDNFIDEIIGYFDAHEPLGPFIEFTSMDAGRFLPLEMGESDEAEDNYVCFEDDDLPLSCEL